MKSVDYRIDSMVAGTQPASAEDQRAVKHTDRAAWWRTNAAEITLQLSFEPCFLSSLVVLYKSSNAVSVSLTTGNSVTSIINQSHIGFEISEGTLLHFTQDSLRHPQRFTWATVVFTGTAPIAVCYLTLKESLSSRGKVSKSGVRGYSPITRPKQQLRMTDFINPRPLTVTNGTQPITSRHRALIASRKSSKPLKPMIEYLRPVRPLSKVVRQSYAGLLAGCVVYLDIADSQLKRLYQELAAVLGLGLRESLELSVQLIVTDCQNGDIFGIGQAMNLPVVSLEWVNECVKQRRKLEARAFVLAMT